MSDDKKAKSTTTTALELGLLAGVGGWFCVSSLMEILGHAPKGNALAQATAGVIGALGVWPTFLTSLGLAALGAWSFLSTRDVGAFRDAIGVLFVGAGLSIALGPFPATGPSMGGGVGEVVPSFVAGRLGVGLAVGLGLAVILATAWLLWLPEGDGFSPKPGEQRQVRAAGHPEAGGVSPAEAEALVADVPRAAAVPSAPRTPSPADDIRNKGGVPAGTRPLTKLHERPGPEDHDQDGPRPWRAAPPDRAADELAGADLDAPGTAPARGADVARPLAAEAGESAAPALSPKVRPLEDLAPNIPDRPIWEAAAEVPAAELFAEPEPPATEPAWDDPADLPAAAWEEPHEAYAPPVDDVLVLERDAVRAEPEVVSEVLAEDDPEEDAEELEDVLAEDNDEQEPEEDDELEDEDALALQDVPGPAAPEPAAPEPAEAAAEAPSEAEVVLKPRGKQALKIQQSSLFPDAETAGKESAGTPPDEKPARSKAPRAAKPVPVPHAEPAAAIDSPEDLIQQAGFLILDENRVAVSMLQRRFELDFDAATAVLDTLQQRGLIGPYLGGKTRDILMTREEWTAHAHGV